MASKTKTKNSGVSAFLAKHWWKIGILILFIASASFIGYNKYLDQQNVNNMKQLLADFEQLKIDAETETGEAFYIEADCGTGGEKFKPIYSCDLRLKTTNDTWSQEISNFMSNRTEGLAFFEGCELLSKRSIGFDASENFYKCSVSVRNNNQEKAEAVFYDYDTSPGRPF